MMQGCTMIEPIVKLTSSSHKMPHMYAKTYKLHDQLSHIHYDARLYSNPTLRNVVVDLMSHPVLHVLFYQ